MGRVILFHSKWNDTIVDKICLYVSVLPFLSDLNLMRCIISLSLIFLTSSLLSELFSNTVVSSDAHRHCFYFCDTIHINLSYQLYLIAEIKRNHLIAQDRRIIRIEKLFTPQQWRERKTISISCYQCESNTFVLELSMVFCCCYCCFSSFVHMHAQCTHMNRNKHTNTWINCRKHHASYLHEISQWWLLCFQLKLKD